MTVCSTGFAAKAVEAEAQIHLVHGEPLLFGRRAEQGPAAAVDGSRA